MAEGRTAWPKIEDDWFQEPIEATNFLLRYEYFNGNIWDPAAGGGHVVQACLLDGKGAVGTDLRDRVTKRRRDGGRSTPSWFVGAQDFLAWPAHGLLLGCSNIITNPPYGRAKLAEAFIRHALAMPGLEKAAFFVNSKFLFGAGRARGLFAEHPPNRIYPVLPRPSCPPGQFLLDGGKAEGGVENFVWLVFSSAEPPEGTLWCWPPAGGAKTPHLDAPRQPRG